MGGWSILWREEDADRWSWFIRKIFSFFKGKNPLGRFGVCPLLMEERTLRIRGLGSAFDPERTWPRRTFADNLALWHPGDAHTLNGALASGEESRMIA